MENLNELKEIINLNLKNLNNVIFGIDTNQKLLKELLNDENLSSNNKSSIDKIFSEYFEDLKLKIDTLTKFWKNTKTSIGGISLNAYIDRFNQNQSLFLNKMKKLGVFILSKKSSKPIGFLRVNKAITHKNWIKIAFDLKENEEFQKIKPQLNDIIIKIRNENFKKEIVKIKENYPEITNTVIEEYRENYLKSKQDFDEFWMDYSSKSEEKTEVITKKKTTHQTRRSQENSRNFDDYDAYLSASERDLARMKRKGIYGKKKTSRRVKRNRKTRD